MKNKLLQRGISLSCYLLPLFVLIALKLDHSQLRMCSHKFSNISIHRQDQLFHIWKVSLREPLTAFITNQPFNPNVYHVWISCNASFIRIKRGSYLPGLCPPASLSSIERGLATERARRGTFRGFGTERARLGTYRSFGTERAGQGTF